MCDDDVYVFGMQLCVCVSACAMQLCVSVYDSVCSCMCLLWV